MIPTRRVVIRTILLRLSLNRSFARLKTALIVQTSKVPCTEISTSVDRKVSLSPKPQLHHKEHREVRKVGWAAWHMGGGRGKIVEGLLGIQMRRLSDFRRILVSGMTLEDYLKCVRHGSPSRLIRLRT